MGRIKWGATLHMLSLVRFEVVGNMHFVVVEGKEGVGNMHFIVAEVRRWWVFSNWGIIESITTGLLLL